MLKKFFSILNRLSDKLRISLFALLFLICFTALIEVASIYSFGASINYITSDEPTIFSKIGYSDDSFLIATAILLLSSGALMSYTLYFRAKVAFKVGGFFSKIVFKNKVLDEITNVKLSEVINDVTYETDRFARSYISELLQFVVRLMISLALTVYIVIFISVDLFTYVIAIIGAYILIAYALKSKIRETGKIITRENELRYQLVKNGFLGIRDFRTLNKYNFIFDRFSNVVDKYNLANARVQYFSLIPRYAIESLVLVVILISLGYGKGNESLSSFDVGVVSSSFLAILKLLPQISQAYQSLSNLYANRASLDRIYASLKKSSAPNLHTAACYKYDSAKTTSIFLRDVGFSYDDKVVLSTVSYDFVVGDINYIVGPSGSGKSTLLDIICGFKKPLHGQLSGFVSKNDTDCFSYTSQQPFIFDGSIKENLTLGEPLISDELCWEALKAVELADLFQSNESQLDTVIGERGITLSGGQAQRLSIARAICFDKPIQIYDEPTSALDSATSEVIINNLRRLAENRLIIVVTHDDNYIDNSNCLELIRK